YTDDPKNWKTKVAPGIGPENVIARGQTFGLALDSKGDPGIAFVSGGDSTSEGRVAYWRPSADLMVQAADLQDNQDDFPAASLAFSGDNPRILTSGSFDEANLFDDTVWFTRSDDKGASWTKPVPIPPSGDRSTNYPFSLTLDSKGNAAIALASNSGSGGSTCAPPFISRAAINDLGNWASCGPKDPKQPADFSVYPESLNLKFAANDKLFMLWLDNNDYGSGLYFWSEP